jgi:hypothetical protein
MELYKWGEVAEELSSLASRKNWAEMPELISDEMLAEFATIASQRDLPAALLDRYQDIADRMTIYTPFVPSERDSFWQHLITEMV